MATILGIITARGGSVRLPGKNMADLGGKPLLQWTVEAAQEAELPSVVSSDDHGILAWCREHGYPCVRRPADLAESTTASIDVVRHHWREDDFPDMTVLLQPTSPFRTGDDILRAVAMMTHDCDAVFSVAEAATADLYEMGLGRRLRAVEGGRNLWVANGAIYCLSGTALANGHDWFNAPLVYGYGMPAWRSIDIDTQADLDRARAQLLGDLLYQAERK